MKGSAVASKFEEMMEMLENLFDQLKKLGLLIKPSKCRIGLSSVKWLGHMVSNNGVKPDPELVSTITNWPPPSTAREVRALYGTLSYFRRFLKNFARRTIHMRKLMRKDADFQWSTKEQEELDEMKVALTSAPILGHPNFDATAEPFIVTVDTSKDGIGNTLSQVQVVTDPQTKKESTHEVVISYGSRNRGGAHTNWNSWG
jgi:hypothetical protein